MLKKNRLFKQVVLIVIAMVSSTSLYAQFNGGNVASPYSMFGLGDLRTSNTAANRSMGGVGFAVREALNVNISNPASFSIAPKQSFTLAMGAEGINSYMKSSTSSSSHNTASFSYFAVRFPIANGLGFGFSISPYSSAGYSIRVTDQRDDIIADIGNVNYLYSGKGDIAQYKAGFGWHIFKGFSVGANFIYYLGNLDRSIAVLTNPYTSNQIYASVYETEKTTINQAGLEVGFQYHFMLSKKIAAVLGGVYQPKIRQTARLEHLTASEIGNSGSDIDTLYSNKSNPDFSFPEKIGAGLTIMSDKFRASFDYSFEDFSSSFSESMKEEDLRYQAKHSFMTGLEYTPDNDNIYNYSNRISYRMGLRYSNSYYKYNGNNVNEAAVSVGLGFPLNSTISAINFGLEYATRGAVSQGMLRTHYLNFFVDISIFANKGWFTRYKHH